MSSIDYIDRYIFRIDEELRNKDNIPNGMPKWIYDKLIASRNILVDKNISDEDIEKICVSLDEIFYYINALCEKDDVELIEKRDYQLNRDDEISRKVADEVWEIGGSRIR